LLLLPTTVQARWEGERGSFPGPATFGGPAIAQKYWKRVFHMASFRPQIYIKSILRRFPRHLVRCWGDSPPNVSSLSTPTEWDCDRAPRYSFPDLDVALDGPATVCIYTLNITMILWWMLVGRSFRVSTAGDISRFVRRSASVWNVRGSSVLRRRRDSDRCTYCRYRRVLNKIAADLLNKSISIGIFSIVNSLCVDEDGHLNTECNDNSVTISFDLHCINKNVR